MFESARWRLTFWFSGVVIVILVVIGIAVLLTARAQLFDQVNDDLQERARQNILRPGIRLNQNEVGQRILELATTGGYFYALGNDSGEFLIFTNNVDQEALPVPEQVADVTAGKSVYVDTKSEEGEDLRVYVAQGIDPRSDQPYLVAVGRSTEPERQALRQILIIIAGGGIAGVGLAVVGGFWLSGLALRPISQSIERQRAFVADASHELRTPLTLIRANAELLKRDRDKPQAVNETSDEIIAETDRLSALVGQMLTLARSDADTDAFEMARVNLAAIAADTARQMRLLADPKQITIEADTNGTVDVEGDETRLRELVTILVDNSIKYSDEGASVNVRVGQVNGQAELTVTDTGRGIPPAAMPRLFDRFYRVDKARSREMGGTGLGLAIAKWIVDAHGGEIQVESAEGRGTTVRVALPAAG